MNAYFGPTKESLSTGDRTLLEEFYKDWLALDADMLEEFRARLMEELERRILQQLV